MNWFAGEVSSAIQKAIQEKKVFLVYVKGSVEDEDTKKMEELWLDEQISGICSDDKCVAINIEVNSIAGQQFASIYPILVTPTTYLISNDGLPVNIIQGVREKSDFLQSLIGGVKKALESNVLSQKASTDETGTNISANEHTIDTQSKTGTEEMQQIDELPASSNSQNPTSSEKVELLLEKSRSLKAEKEKQKRKEEEQKRREVGQELSLAKRDQAERQAKKLADELAKQKAEEKAARERVREQIRLDRAEKAARREQEKKEKEVLLEKKREEKDQVKIAKQQASSNTSRLQFRLPDGSSVHNTFPADAMFSTVESFVMEQLQGSYPAIRLTTVYPKREFTSEHSKMTLRELQLIPNASIIVSPGRTKTVSNTSWNPLNIIQLIFSPIFLIFNFVFSLFGNAGKKKDSSTASTSSSSTTEPTGMNNTRSSTTTRRRVTGNINRLRHDDDDENATWNGNSTQQM